MERTGPDTLRAQCGVTLTRLAREAQQLGLGGMEFAHGIPGSLGGGVSMNAGAYGGEMKDIVVSTRYLDGALELSEAVGAAHDFSYRRSRFSDTDDVILDSTLRFTPGDPETIHARMAELREKRRASQPLELPSAGSTFKRPEGNFAGKLIMEAGLRGFRVGDAQVSEKHCGFVVNRGSATAAQVRELMEKVQEEVLRHSGVRLEPEVRFLGEF